MKGILKNWDIARLIRLIMGAGFTFYGLYSGNHFIVLPGILLVILALLNWSCCAAGGCSTSTGTKATYKQFVEPYTLNNNRNNKK